MKCVDFGARINAEVDSFGITALFSAVLLAATLALSIAAFFLNPSDDRVSVGSRFHMGVWRGGGDTLGRFVFFNDAEYGPYRGSIIALSDAEGNLSPPLERQIGWGYSFGVYYRFFRWPDGQTLWTLMVSLWYPLLMFGALPAVWLWCRSSAIDAPETQSAA